MGLPPFSRTSNSPASMTSVPRSTVAMAHTATLTMPWYLQHVKRTIDVG